MKAGKSDNLSEGGSSVVRTVFRQFPRRTRAVVFGAMAGAVLALAGCAADTRIKTRSIAIDVAPNANADNALAVDVVLIHDAALLASVGEMPSTNWFKNRAQLMLANPTGMEVQSFEVIPGQKGPRYTVTGRGNDALGAFVFADYGTPGVHRARVDGLPTVLLRLGEKDFAVAAQPAS